MSQSPSEPSPEPAEPAEPAEPEPGGPNSPEKQPELPDPAFPEVLPGGDDAPGKAADSQIQQRIANGRWE